MGAYNEQPKMQYHDCNVNGNDNDGDDDGDDDDVDGKQRQRIRLRKIPHHETIENSVFVVRSLPSAVILPMGMVWWW